jgi:hypothetical protein
MSSFLRVAEGLDRRQMQIIRAVRVRYCDKSIEIEVIPWRSRA